MNLYLFDIDHTMLDIDHIHEEAYKRMYDEIYNTEFRLCLPRGEERTTHNIIRCGLRGKIPGKEIEKQMGDAINHMVRLYISRVNPLFVHTNVGNVVDKLGESGVVGVFTGGSKAVSDIILKKSQLYGKFHHISTCDDASTRSGIVEHAIEKSSLGRKFDKIFVIGDSPEDINAAKANNAVAVAVTLGKYTKEELEKAGADIIIEDWRDQNWILEQLK
jgi:phosphoglycolate phosphatase